MANINFSNETTKQLLDCKNAQVEALQKDRQKNIDFLKRLIEYVEDRNHSENEWSEDFLSEGEMLDIVVDQLKKFTSIRDRLNNPQL